MTIPSELTYDDELQFTDRFVLPLLQRLGFSLVVHYHGTREFGKDLVFGEIDRFGHVVYHGMQVKYVASISLANSDELIQDARQAFRNPFRHPQKGNDERISTFVLVNGGGISEQGRDNFFNTLRPEFGANVRLIDGKGLLSLDRLATMNRVESLGERLRGLLLEIRSNIASLQPLASMEPEKITVNTVPICSLRLLAAAALLERPFLPNDIPYDVINDYWQQATMFNLIAPYIPIRMQATYSTDKPLDEYLAIAKQILERMGIINTALCKVLADLGPLAAI